MHSLCELGRGVCGSIPGFAGDLDLGMGAVGMGFVIRRCPRRVICLRVWLYDSMLLEWDCPLCQFTADILV